MKNYLSLLFTCQTANATPQWAPAAGTVSNSTGGHVFPVDDWTRLDRFLLLGSEGGSYYAGEAVLTRDNAQAVLRAIAADGARAVARIVAVSEGGRAPKNDPSLFALALAAAADDLGTRRAALAALPRVARTGTHLFQFAAFARAVEEDAPDRGQYRVAEVAVKLRHCAGDDAAAEAVAHDELPAGTQLLDERLELAEIVAVVTIGHDNVFAVGSLDSAAKRAAVAASVDWHDPGAQLRGDPLRSVRAAVVGDEDLAVYSGLIHERLSFFDTGGQCLSLVEARHEDRKLHAKTPPSSPLRFLGRHITGGCE